MVTKVVNLRKESYDVYIGRDFKDPNGRGLFGNPFSVKKFGREECLRKFAQYFYKKMNLNPDFQKKILALKDKRLGCFCKPKSCHGDIIASYIDEYFFLENSKLSGEKIDEDS